jgi:hypothetical protein
VSVPQQRATHGSIVHLASKPEVEEEEDEMTTLLRQQCLVASRDDPEDLLGFNAVFMSSLNNHSTWEGIIEDLITMFIRASGRPLVDLTSDDGNARPSGAVKDEPADLSGKQDIVHDEDYSFFPYYTRSGRRRRHSIILWLNLDVFHSNFCNIYEI